MDTDAGDDGASVDFSPQSPWSRPPIHRPAPRPEPETSDEPTVDAIPIAAPPMPQSTLVLAAPPIPEYAYYDPSPVHPYSELDVALQYPVPTADELTARRTVRPREWVATTGVRAAARRGTFGLVRLRPSLGEREGRANLAAVRRAFGGLRQITVVNPKGGAGKTVATLMLGLAFGQTRGGFVLAWDNNETQGTLGMRAQQDVHGRTVRDLLRDLGRFGGPGGRIGELSAYVRAQEEAAFHVLASDEAATAGEMLTATAFREIRDVVGRFYKLLLVDTGNNVRAENWQAAVDATDQLRPHDVGPQRLGRDRGAVARPPRADRPARAGPTRGGRGQHAAAPQGREPPRDRAPLRPAVPHRAPRPVRPAPRLRRTRPVRRRCHRRAAAPGSGSRPPSPTACDHDAPGVDDPAREFFRTNVKLGAC